MQLETKLKSKVRKKRRKQPEVIIKRILGASVLAPFFIAKGMVILSSILNDMPDEQLSQLFPKVYAIKDIRAFYKTLSTELNDDG